MIKKPILLIVIFFSAFVHAQNNNESAIVLELFTSQGCSSCPAADELLDEIKTEHKDKNVFVLSYHVDYWNRLGWKDPFSSSTYSDYQRDYAQQFNSRSIYTPQLVVNGDIHFTGSNRGKAIQAIDEYKKTKSLTTISLDNIEKKASEISLDYNVEGKDFKQLTLVLVVAERITKVQRGENRSRTLTNTNIVATRLLKSEGSGKVTLQIPNWVLEKDELSVIAYTQDDKLKTTGAISIKI